MYCVSKTGADSGHRKLYRCVFCVVFVQQCFDEVERVYDETSGREKKVSREDWAHGSLLITIELLRCSNVAAEVCSLI